MKKKKRKISDENKIQITFTVIIAQKTCLSC